MNQKPEAGGLYVKRRDSSSMSTQHSTQRTSIVCAKVFVFASRASLLATFCAPLTKSSWYKKMQEATLLATFRKRSGACQLRLRFLTQRQNQKRGKRRFSFRFSPLASPIFLFHFACGHPFSLRDAHVSYVSYVHIVLSKNPILDSYGMYILFKLLGG